MPSRLPAGTMTLFCHRPCLLFFMSPQLHATALTRRQVAGFSTLLILPLLLLVCLPWQPFIPALLHEDGLWWLYALTRTVDLPGIAVTTVILLLLTRHKLKLDHAAFVALAGALFALLACDWLLKSLIKQLTEEPRPYLLWLESQSFIPAIKAFYASATELRSEQVHAASQLLALPDWLGHHWQAEVKLRLPLRPQYRRHRAGAVFRPDLAGPCPRGSLAAPLVGTGNWPVSDAARHALAY